MNEYLQKRICDIAAADFQSLIGELCESVRLHKAEIENQPLSFLFMVIVREKKKMALENVLMSQILETKVGKLPVDSIVYRVCCELVNVNHLHIELFSGKSVFTLIKRCHKFFAPKERRVKKLSSY